MFTQTILRCLRGDRKEILRLLSYGTLIQIQIKL